jgi:hypothetical protein
MRRKTPAAIEALLIAGYGLAWPRVALRNTIVGKY